MGGGRRSSVREWTDCPPHAEVTQAARTVAGVQEDSLPVKQLLTRPTGPGQARGMAGGTHYGGMERQKDVNGDTVTDRSHPCAHTWLSELQGPCRFPHTCPPALDDPGRTEMPPLLSIDARER